MNAKDFEYLVKCGVKAFDLVAAIGQSIRDAASEESISMTETDFANILTEVHRRAR